MWVVLGLMFALAPVVALCVYEAVTKRRHDPLADRTRTTVLDGLTVSIPALAPPAADRILAGPLFTDFRDAERCATESRLVRELLDGALDRTRYHAEMAALAAAGQRSA